MAQIKIELYGDGTLIKVFDQSDLISYNLRTEASNDPQTPIFDIYPSSGTLVIQDKEQELYNIAVNGGFDYTQFETKLYINDDDIVVYRNISTDLPVYSAEDKTLTLTLTDELDRASTETYDGYNYPLESKNLYEIYVSVLCSYLGKSYEDIGADLDNFYSSAVYNEMYDMTIKDYLESIVIPYPYMEQDTYRNTFKKILTVAGLAMVWTSGEYPTLIALTGVEQSEYITAITADRITERFSPTVIPTNKYNSIDIDSKKAIVEYHSDEACYTAENIKEGFQFESTWDTDTKNAIVLYCDNDIVTNTYYGYYKEITVVPKGAENGSIYNYNYNYDEKGGGVIEFSKYQDENKRSISFLVVDEGNNKPNYSITCIVRISKQQGKFTANYVGQTGQEFYFDKETFTSTNAFAEVSNTTVANYALSSTITDSAITGVGTEISMSLGFRVGDASHNISYSDGESPKYSDRTKMFAGYIYYVYCTGTIDNNAFSGINFGQQVEIDGWCYKYEIIPISMSVTYYGNFSQLVFEDKSYKETKSGSGNRKNNCSIYDGGELMQYTEEGEADTTENTIPEQVAETTLDNYRNGLQVGTLQCIGWNYYGFNVKGDDTSGYKADYLAHVYLEGVPYRRNQLFEVGELVVPCQDSSKYLPIVKKGKNIPIFQVLQVNTTISKGGSTTQSLTIRELPCDYKSELIPVKISNYGCGLRFGYITEFDGSTPTKIYFVPSTGKVAPDTINVSGCTYSYSKNDIETTSGGSNYNYLTLLKPLANATQIKVVITCIAE